MPDLSLEIVSTIAEQLGVVLLLVLNIVAIWRKWFVPYYLVDELQRRAERAETDGRYWRDVAVHLMTGTSRSLAIAERTTDLLVKQNEAQP